MAEELTFSHFPFLAELGLTEENDGCFDGENWGGSGPVFTSYNPATGLPIARIRTVRDAGKSSGSLAGWLVGWLTISCELVCVIVVTIGLARRL